jgi:hypothetical protein
LGERLADLICKQMRYDVGGATGGHCNDDLDGSHRLRRNSVPGKDNAQKAGHERRCQLQKSPVRRFHGVPRQWCQAARNLADECGVA